MYLTMIIVNICIPLAILAFWGVISGYHAIIDFVTDRKHKPNFMTVFVHYLFSFLSDEPIGEDCLCHIVLPLIIWSLASLIWPAAYIFLLVTGLLYLARYLYRQRKEN